MGSEEGNGASQHPCSSDVALRKMVAEEVDRRLNTLRGELLMVKEELQLVEEKLGGTRNGMPKEMILQLKFLVEVSDTIQTGKLIKGINDECLQLALVDATGHIVSCGPESSARVEILLLDATSGNEYDDENELTRENFERRIIREADKKKPHFTRSLHIHLVKGVGVLTGVKLGHDSDWTKNCNCRLGARIVQKFSGVDVRETWTAPFKVVDCRSIYYKKSERPSPSSKVWKLKKIGRAGPPCKRLKDKKIETVLDFLFWLSVNDKELQEEILEAGDGNWQTTVTHAKTCIVDDKSIYSHKSSTVPQTAVVYDAIGKLKGLIDESHFVSVDDLSADKKDHAHKLLRSVLEPSIFVERYKTLFDDEASLLQQFPYRSSENIHGHQTIGPASSSQTQSIIASDIYDSGPSDFLASQETGELRNHSLRVFPDPENIDGDTATDLDNENHENHCFPTDKADSQELLASFVDLYDPQQQLSGTSELVGDCQYSLVYFNERSLVKEEVDSALRKYIINTKRNCGKDAHSSESRSLCLQFGSAISLPVFIGTRIEGEGCTQLEVALIDLLTGEVVSSGLGSSAKVEVVVLEGDFDADGRDNWTLVEFQNYIVRERDGKKPLLTGDLVMNLQDGKGLVGNVIFTDNSSWTRSRKFRLGARLLDSIGGISRVREARSEPFVVRDHLREVYKKHYPPSLSDEVWRLEKIGKDGAFHKRLRKASVNTVEDFLVSLSVDPTRLRNILGTGMSAKMWEAVVEHARTCVLDQKLYFYGASQKNGVVFNVVGQVMGSISNGQYLDADELSEAEKTEARELVISAFADREKIVCFDDGISPNLPTSSKSLSIAQSSSNLLSETTIHDDLSSSQNLGGSSFLQQNASSPDYMQSLYSVEGLSSFEDCLHHVDPVEIRCDQDLDYPGQVADSLLCNADTLNQTFCADELHYFDRDCVIQSSHLELSADIQGAIAAYIPCSDISINKAQRGWKILVFVLRWWFSIKRRLMARKTRV